MTSSSPLILAGDLGGTNFRVALFRAEEGMKRLASQKFHSASHHSLEEMVGLFLEPLQLDAPLKVACFGVPGPNVSGVVSPVNLDWKIEVNSLPKGLGIPHVAVLNDLEATAYGISLLSSGDLEVLQAGAGSSVGNQCVIAPGTGLGEAGLFWDGLSHTPWACEGGHADFAPANETQQELLDYLRRDYRHVSAERVISGQGIANIYRFLRDTKRGIEQEAIAQEMLQGDATAVIARHAADNSCALCRATIELFIEALGAEASNMALKTMAQGGVFLGGGIPPKSLHFLKEPRFLENFLNKGRFRPLLEKMPVQVILNDETALLGAAVKAVRLLHSL